MLREFAGLERTPIPPAPVLRWRSTTRPASLVAAAGIPLVAGYEPLTDLGSLYGVYGYGLPPVAAPAHGEPPADLVDDTPAMIAATWNPPLDIK